MSPSAGTAAARTPGRPRDVQVDADILEAALDLLIELGYSATSMEAVAARAGVAKTTVYRRWPTKDDLIIDALARIKGEIATPPPGTVRTQLVFLINHMREHWSDRRQMQLMQRLTADGIERPERYREIRTRVMRPRHNVVRDCLQRGVDAGDLDPAVDLNWAVSLLVAPIIAAGLTHQPRFSAAQVEFVVDTVLRGLARR